MDKPFKVAAVCLVAIGGCLTLGNAKLDPQRGPRPAADLRATPLILKGADTRCYGTSRPTLPCEAVSAQAAIDQAKDADRLAGIAWWQFGVGVATLIAAFLAALFAQRAAHHTKRAADRAGEANELTSVMTRRQLRPYIFPSHAGFRINDDGEPIVTITVKNFGQTPALDKRGWTHTWIERFPLPAPLPRPDATLFMSAAVIGPGATSIAVQPHGNAPNEISLEEIGGRRAAFYVYGGGTYSDIFGADHDYEFCFFAQGEDWIERGMLSPYTSGNAMAFEGESR